MMGQSVGLDVIDEGIGLRLNLVRNNWDVRRWCRQVGLIDDLHQKRWYYAQSERSDINMFAIVEGGRKEGACVGICGLTDIDLVHSRAEFSLYIFPEYRLKGYAKDGLWQILKYGFDTLGLNQIWGETFEGNPAYKMFKDIGMQDDGIRRQFYFKDGHFLDAHLISMTSEEWREIR